MYKRVCGTAGSPGPALLSQHSYESFTKIGYDTGPMSKDLKESALDSTKQPLDIEGMHCASCAQSVERALSNLAGVQEAHVNLLANQALIEHDGSTTTDQLIDAVRNAGFDASLPAEAARVVRLGVDGMTCAGCVANVERALKSVPGVQDAAVNLATGMAQATITSSVSEEQLAQAVLDAGFQVRAATTDRSTT